MNYDNKERCFYIIKRIESIEYEINEIRKSKGRLSNNNVFIQIIDKSNGNKNVSFEADEELKQLILDKKIKELESELDNIKKELETL